MIPTKVLYCLLDGTTRSSQQLAKELCRCWSKLSGRAVTIRRLQAELTATQNQLDSANNSACELREIVDRLPKDAEGNSVATGDMLWMSGTNCPPFPVTVATKVVIRYPDRELSRCDTGCLHRTRESAEKARTP